MLNRILLLLFSLLTSFTFGQTIQELEYDLSWHSSSETYGAKIDKAKKLQEIDPFNYIATEYICRYYNDRQIDSVSIYFDNLIAKFPGRTTPYILRSTLLFLEFDYTDRDNYNSRKIKFLQQGLIINPKDQTIIFLLAEIYYKDFIYPLEKENDFGLSIVLENGLTDSTIIFKDKQIKRSTFEHAADSSLMYFYQLWVFKKDNREIIYFPIRQLECFLNIGSSKISKDFESNFNQCYFPPSYFSNLNEKWECDFTMDYLFEIQSGIETAEWLEVQLNDLKENCLFNREVERTTTIFRFTWLRSFHQPITIRIENNASGTNLIWKVGNGEGGYEPKGLKKSRRKKLSIIEWEKFEKLVIKSKFSSLQNREYIPMNDGATWTLERKTYDSFKAHNTNWPSKDFKEACLYLLNLTNIKVKDSDVY